MSNESAELQVKREIERATAPVFHRLRTLERECERLKEARQAESQKVLDLEDELAACEAALDRETCLRSRNAELDRAVKYRDTRIAELENESGNLRLLLNGNEYKQRAEEAEAALTAERSRQRKERHELEAEVEAAKDMADDYRAEAIAANSRRERARVDAAEAAREAARWNVKHNQQRDRVKELEAALERARVNAESPDGETIVAVGRRVKASSCEVEAWDCHIVGPRNFLQGRDNVLVAGSGVQFADTGVTGVSVNRALGLLRELADAAHGLPSNSALLAEVRGLLRESPRPR